MFVDTPFVIVVGGGGDCFLSLDWTLLNDFSLLVGGRGGVGQQAMCFLNLAS